ncbi:hypothetical protein BDR26DRAFT_457828 [Obelidium mucronatum]|nr:hypothetical protein BDR26DRAFT_457828 [Obelidium mucronatum]
MNTLPDEILCSIFAKIYPTSAIKLKRLCRRLCDCLETQHFAELNLKLCWPIIPSASGLQTAPNAIDRYRLAWEGRDLSGRIPKAIGTLTNLTHLSLFRNSLTGSIPREIGLLVHLEQLYLNSNALIGSIPQEICSLQNLHYLYLNNNMLDGDIPSRITELSQLRFLMLHSNQLTGTLPGGLLQLPCMEYMSLTGNLLEKRLPKSCLQRSRLVALLQSQGFVFE